MFRLVIYEAITFGLSSRTHSGSVGNRIRPRAELLNITQVSLNIIVVILMGLAKARKVGGSLVVTLPKELVESKKIKEGEIIEITVKKIKKDGFGTFRGLSPFTVKDELTAHE